MRTLGIDFGEKRVGLAVSDALGITAQGIATLDRQGKKPILEAVSQICSREGIEEIVIGLPVNMDGSLGPKAREVLEWVPEVEKKLGLPVKTWDERLSSRQASRLMLEEGLSRRKQKMQSDRLAATLILQSYLEFKRR